MLSLGFIRKKHLGLSIVLCLITVCAFSQKIRLTPQLVEEFIEFIEDNAISLEDYLASSNDLSMFTEALKLTNDFSAFAQGDEYTVFAPKNAGFHEFPVEVIQEMFLPRNIKKLQSITRYHIVRGRLRASQIIEAIEKNGGEAKFRSLNGLDLTTYFKDGTIFIKDDNGYSIKVLQQDILLSNGLVYKIDTVILPQVDNDLENNKR